MKTLILILAALAVLATAATSHAGGIGNGGFILECLEKGKIIYKLYDYTESADLMPDLGGPGLSTKQRIAHVLDRLAKVNPTRAAIYKDLATNFFVDYEPLKKDGEFINVSDLGAAQKPANCKLRQLVQQRSAEEKPSSNTKTYLVDMPLFKKIEDAGFTDVTAGIVIHEVVYHESLNTAAKPQIYSMNPSPTFVRYYNAFISSTKMNGISQADYIWDLVKDAGKDGKNAITYLLDSEGQKIQVKIDLYGIYLPGQFSFGSEKWNFISYTGVLLNRSRTIIGCTDCGGRVKTVLSPEMVYASKPTFYENGNLRSAALSKPLVSDFFGAVLHDMPLVVQEIYFNDQGIENMHRFNYQTTIDVGLQKFLIWRKPTAIQQARFDAKNLKYTSFGSGWSSEKVEVAGNTYDVKLVVPVAGNWLKDNLLLKVNWGCITFHRELNDVKPCSPAEEKILEEEDLKVSKGL